MSDYQELARQVREASQTILKSATCIEVLGAQVAELKAELRTALRANAIRKSIAEARVAELEAELEAALEPFADVAQWGDETSLEPVAHGKMEQTTGMFAGNDGSFLLLRLAPGCPPITVGDLRRARATLATESASAGDSYTRKDVMPSEQKLFVDVPHPALHDLLPCPFCGKPAKLKLTTRGQWWVQCTAPYLCMGRAWSTLGEGFRLPQDAIDAWNRRAPAPANSAAIIEECELAALRAVGCAPHKDAGAGEGRKQLERRAYINGARAAAQNVAALAAYDGIGPAGAIPEHGESDAN